MMWLGNVLMAVGVGILIVMVPFWWMLRRINARLDAKLQELGRELESKFIPLDVELDNGMYFCYNAKDRSFVCQGRTALEIRESFENRFPGHVAFLNNQEAVPELTQELIKLKSQDA